MSSQNPPNPNVETFNNDYWIQTDNQGSQTLQEVLIQGNSAGLKSINMNNQDITSIGTATMTTLNSVGTASFVANPTCTAVQPVATDTSTKIPTTYWVQTAITAGTSAKANNVAGGNAGDLLYQSAVGTTAKLPIGANTYVLTSNGTIPTWSASSGAPTLANVLLAGNNAGSTSIDMSNNDIINGLNIGATNLYSNTTYIGNGGNTSAIQIGDTDLASVLNNSIQIGRGANLNATGTHNVAIGNYSNSGGAGAGNTVLGSYTLTNCSSGNFNTMIGREAGNTIFSGSNNTCLGKGTIVADNLTYATAIGSEAYCSTSNTIRLGRNTDVVSLDAIVYPNTINIASSTNNCNIDIGADNLSNVFTTKSNIAIGTDVMNGFGLTATANNNIGLGVSTLNTLTTGSNNLGIGSVSAGVSSGSNNSVIGYQAGQSIGSGSENTVIGRLAGSRITNTSNHTIIGSGANTATTSTTLATAIGNNAVAGNSCVSIGNGAGGTGQGASCVAIGAGAGVVNQGATSVAIGLNAGYSGLGTAAIAIGGNAGVLNQVANSICLNASNTAVNPNQAGCFIRPLRGVALGIGVGRVFYDTTTFELQYSTT